MVHFLNFFPFPSPRKRGPSMGRGWDLSFSTVPSRVSVALAGKWLAWSGPI